MEIKGHLDKAELVFGRLLAALAHKEYPYDRTEEPQVHSNLPPSLPLGKVEHARFLFYACLYMRGGIKSDEAIRRMSQLYGRHPSLFDPFSFSKRYKGDVERVAGSLSDSGLGFGSGRVGGYWVLNSRKLARFWSGDPRMLFGGVSDYRGACERIINGGLFSEDSSHGFLGFREKMVSMLIHFLAREGMIESILFPPPVDFHILRVVLEHEVITVHDVKPEENIFKLQLTDAVRALLVQYCEQHKADPLELGAALWLLSRTLCKLHPGNGTRRVGEYWARRIVLVPVEVHWSSTQTRRYERGCGRCPVQGTCRFLIPSLPYYVKGRVEIRGFRRQPPQLHLFRDFVDTNTDMM